VLRLQEETRHVSTQMRNALERMSCNANFLLTPTSCLSRFFDRNYMGKGVSRSKCCSCMSDRESGDWTPSQAEKSFRVKGLGSSIHLKCNSSAVVSSGWCKGSELYSSQKITWALIEAHGSIWNLHWDLAKYEKRSHRA
jgi:hypothetical protein